MHKYTFTDLNPHEFQSLINDLLAAEYGVHVERFKSGKDKGIDGRFFESEKGTSIIQSKHYIESGKKRLIYDLENNELPKLRKLCPDRYIVATSVPLLEGDKSLIKDKLAPYIISTSDIYGKDDINSLLAKFKSVELNHYKLWIASSAVLDRFVNSSIYNASDELVLHAIRSSKSYVKTIHHDRAKKALDERNVVIITGEPGVGKTTLAEQLCLQYVHLGFQLVVMTEGIRDGLALLNKEIEQMFYYDDFLGSNYLDAIRGNKDTKIMQFISSVKNNPKSRFILTSRTNILDQGYRLSQAFSSKTLAENEYTLNIDKLSEYEKALILYSSMWKSCIAKTFLKEFIARERYLPVIKHKNYNPRLIEAITNENLTSSKTPQEYLQYIDDSLNNPSLVWSHSYDIQCDELSRRLIDFVVLANGTIEEKCLAETISRYRKINNISFHSNLSQNFFDIIKPLCRTFINRNMVLDDGIKSAVLSSGVEIKSGQTWYSPFNHSITDFILSRYTNDPNLWAEMIFYFPSNEGLKRISSLMYSQKELATSIINKSFTLLLNRLHEANPIFISTLFGFLDDGQKNKLASMVELKSIYNNNISLSKSDCSDLIEFCCATITDDTPHGEIIDFLKFIVQQEFYYYALEILSEVCISICIDDSPYLKDLEEIQKKFLERLIEFWYEELIDEFLSENIEKVLKEYSDEDGGYDYEIDDYSLSCMMIDHTGHLFNNIDMPTANDILRWKDLDEVVRSRNMDYDNDRGGIGQPSEGEQGAVDSLFDGFIEAKYGS